MLDSLMILLGAASGRTSWTFRTSDRGEACLSILFRQLLGSTWWNRKNRSDVEKKSFVTFKFKRLRQIAPFSACRSASFAPTLLLLFVHSSMSSSILTFLLLVTVALADRYAMVFGTADGWGNYSITSVRIHIHLHSRNLVACMPCL